MTAPFPPEPPATGGLIADVLAGFSRLVRGEIALAKAEAAQALKGVLRGVVFALVAMVLAAVALGLLAQAAVGALIAAGLTPTMACLALGAVLMLAAFVLVRLALGQLDRASRFPDRSARNLSRDLQSLKAGVTSHAAH